MFKLLKYLLLANLYKRAKKKIILFLGTLFTLIFFTLILNDLLSVADGVNIYLLLITKWVGIFAIFAFMVRTLLQIISMATTLSHKDDTPTYSSTTKESKKEHILAKERLYTKSETILEKYMKD